MFFHRRKIYLERIAPFIDAPVVKVITGMRRVGKSCFLRLLQPEIEDRGVAGDRIIFIDMESLEFDRLRDYRALDDYGRRRSAGGKAKTYLFKDNYPKYVLSLDDFFGDDYQGVKRLHLVDFLLQQGSWIKA